MNKEMGKLGMSDVFKGLILAVIISVVAGIQQMLSTVGFDFAQWDFALIANMAITSFAAYLVKNAASDEDGKFLGKI